MPWLVRLILDLALVRPHLDAPGVGGDCRAISCFCCSQSRVSNVRPGRVAAGIAVPALRGPCSVPSGRCGSANDRRGLTSDLLFLHAGVENVVGDAEAIVQRSPDLHDAGQCRAARRGRPSFHLRVLDAALVCAKRIDLAAVVAVPHMIAVKDMAETIPVRAGLHGETAARSSAERMPRLSSTPE